METQQNTIADNEVFRTVIGLTPEEIAAHITPFDHQLLKYFFLTMFGSFLILLFIPAPYGKFRNSLDSLGILSKKIDGRLGFFWQELPSVVVPFFVLFANIGKIDSLAFLFFLLWQTHYIQRTFIYALIRMKSANQTTIMTSAMAFAFTSINSYLTTKFAIFYPFYDPITVPKIARWFVGMMIFFIGLGGNIWADQVLLNLRNNNGQQSQPTEAYWKKIGKKKNFDQRTLRGQANPPQQGEKQYYIPKGPLYEFVSCPNYLCEIIEWIGLYITFPTAAMLNFVVCTCLNLVPRALSTHKWY